MAGKNSRKQHLPTGDAQETSEGGVDERSLLEIFICNQQKRDEEAETRAEARRVREKKEQLEAEERAEARRLKAEIAAEEREERRKERARVLEAERVAKAKVLEAELAEKAKIAEEERIEARALEKERRKVEETKRQEDMKLEEAKRQEDLLTRSEEVTRQAAEKAAALQEEAAQKVFEQQRELMELQAELGKKAAETQRLESQRVRQKDRAVASISVWQKGEDLEDFLLSSERKLRAGVVPAEEWLGVVASKLGGEVGAKWQEICLVSDDYQEVRGAVLMGCGYTQKAAGEAYYAFRADNLRGMSADQVLRKGVQLLRRLVAPEVLNKKAEFNIVKPWVYANVGRKARAVLEARVIENEEELVKGLQDYLASDGDRLSGRVAVFGSEGGFRRPTNGVGSGLDPGKTGVAGSNGGSSLTCFHCGKVGHKAADCWQRVKPEAGAVEGANKIICFLCGVEGHKATTCPGKREAQKGANVKQVRQIRLAKEKDCVIQGKVNGWGASMVLDSGTQITIVPEDMVEERLKTGEDVVLKGFLADSKTVPTAKVKLGVDGMKEWEEIVALVPAEEGKENEIIYGVDFRTARGLELALLANRLSKVESAEARKVEAVVPGKESTGTGKLVADRPASNPEPVTQVASARESNVLRVEVDSSKEEEWPDLGGLIDSKGMEEMCVLYEEEGPIGRAKTGGEALASAHPGKFPGEIVWKVNRVERPKTELGSSRFKMEQSEEMEKKLVELEEIVERKRGDARNAASEKTVRFSAPQAGVEDVPGEQNHVAEVRRIVVRKPEKALDVILRASAVEQARLEKLDTAKRKKRKKWQGKPVMLDAEVEKESHDPALKSRLKEVYIEKDDFVVESGKVNKRENECSSESTVLSSMSSKPAPCVVHWTGGGLETFTGSKVSPVDVVCLPTLPTQDWDSIAGDPKQEAGGGTKERIEDLQQLEAEGEKEVLKDRSEECFREDTGLRTAPFYFVGGDVGTEAPQKEEAATFGVAKNKQEKEHCAGTNKLISNV